MKWILLLLIKSYWRLIPEKKRKPCLFKETCSRFVYRQAAEHGFLMGVKALLLRIKQCRNGYHLSKGINGVEMKLADGTIISENEISPNLLGSIYKKTESLFDY